MKVLIVCVVPGPRSFNAAMLSTAVEALSACGHEVRVSNLVAMNFDPVCRDADFSAPQNPEHIRYDIEQRFAAENNSFSQDIAAELEKLMWCDCLILQFPLYWFSVPAILKGWIDRVFVNGIIYGGGKWYDRGGLSGKRAMLAFSTGCYPTMCGSDGINGDMDIILWPLQNGVLRFCGMQVLPPFIAWSVAYLDNPKRQTILDDYAGHLRGIETLTALPFHHRSDFGKDWRLNEGITPVAVGQMRASLKTP
ncbi:NAD(P)H-dependent oxidoreductase [Rhodoligotrophos defluvii]|uniref:NAD(P)H-dependent oxidoreductase n=1 Tax=Rhodoligotrophos defluvii TaxID=2561934 RepID=UPI0010C9D8B3|nr:NAD(P)H-dependent oxidoreductase [Rhodoligotrophos defluvii]